MPEYHVYRIYEDEEQLLAVAKTPEDCADEIMFWMAARPNDTVEWRIINGD